jgi:FkbM family methyltransferase
MTNNEADIDKFVLNFFGGYPGNFLDVGSGHPEKGNHTFQLEKYGWSGLCVEPITKFNDQYKKTRPNSIVENYGMVSLDYHDEFIKSYVMDDENLYNVSGINVQNENDYIFWPVKTIDSLVRKHNIRTIDFFSLDVEGYEHEVLHGIDFNYLRFGLIVIEIHNYSWNNRTNDFSYLKEHGYSYLQLLTEKHEVWFNNNLPILRRPTYKSNL